MQISLGRNASAGDVKSVPTSLERVREQTQLERGANNQISNKLMSGLTLKKDDDCTVANTTESL